MAPAPAGRHAYTGAVLIPPTSPASQVTTASTPATPAVQHFRQALLWPVRLMPVADAQHKHHGPWQVLRELGDASPWREEALEYTGDSSRFHERHYTEAVSFLPYVQRFLYAEGRSRTHSGDTASGALTSPSRVFPRPARAAP